MLLAVGFFSLMDTTLTWDDLEAFVEANREALIRMHSPTLGKADAPVTIVEFLDPACETFAAFYPMVKQLMAAHPDRIRLVLRYAPFHNGSDKVVALLEAARKRLDVGTWGVMGIGMGFSVAAAVVTGEQVRFSAELMRERYSEHGLLPAPIAGWLATGLRPEVRQRGCCTDR